MLKMSAVMLRPVNLKSMLTGKVAAVDLLARNTAWLDIPRIQILTKCYLEKLSSAISHFIGQTISLRRGEGGELSGRETEEDQLALVLSVYGEPFCFLLPMRIAGVLTKIFRERMSALGEPLSEDSESVIVSFLVKRILAKEPLFLHHCISLRNVEICPQAGTMEKVHARETVDVGNDTCLPIEVRLSEVECQIPVFVNASLVERISCYARCASCPSDRARLLERIRLKSRLIMQWRLASLYPLLTQEAGERIMLTDNKETIRGLKVCLFGDNHGFMRNKYCLDAEQDNHRTLQLMAGSVPGLFRLDPGSDCLISPARMYGRSKQKEVISSRYRAGI